MGYSNLPPGVTESMLPGNRPEDEWADAVHDMIHEKASEEIRLSTYIGGVLQNLWDEYSTEDDPEYVADMINTRYNELSEGQPE